MAQQAFCTVYSPSELELSMTRVMQVFQNHASKHGERKYLSRRELGDLIQAELNDLLQEALRENPLKAGKIMSELDEDKDGKVNFEEFVSMTARLMMCTSPYFKEYGGTLMCGYI